MTGFNRNQTGDHCDTSARVVFTVLVVVIIMIIKIIMVILL